MRKKDERGSERSQWKSVHVDTDYETGAGMEFEDEVNHEK